MCVLNVREIKYNECLSEQVAVTFQSSRRAKGTDGEEDRTGHSLPPPSSINQNGKRYSTDAAAEQNKIYKCARFHCQIGTKQATI